MRSLFKILFVIGVVFSAYGQSAPERDENIPHLVTFGGDADISWGDDDFCQIFFVKVPNEYRDAFYIRVFDPDTGGDLDEGKGVFNTVVNYSIYGGPGCWSHEDAKGIDPTGNYKSGMMINTKSFGDDPELDGKWYVFGPINPLEGELSEELGGRIFKIIAQGISGDDGNLYSYALSSERDENLSIEGANLFTYEYTFRLSNDINSIAQIFPFIDDKTISVKLFNFDWDNDGHIRVVSIAKNGLLCKVSGEGNWEENNFPIVEEEKLSSIQIQFIKNKKSLVKNNNVVFVVQNQYGESLPFFVMPIGGIPTYNPKFRMRAVE